MDKTTFSGNKWLFLGVFQVLIAVLFVHASYGQEVIPLSGKIMNDSLEDSYLHIMNLNLQRGTITNADGVFTIPARINDTLYISAVQFEDQKIVVTQQIFEQKSLIITLNTAINQLNTVNISNVELSGRLSQDADNVNLAAYIDQTNVGFASTAKKRSHELRALQGAGGFGLGGLISLLTGQKKMLKKHYEISVMEGRIKRAQVQFKTDFYRVQLGIPEASIDDFCYFVYENQEEALQLSKGGSPLKLVDFLMQEAVLYKEHKNMEK